MGMKRTSLTGQLLVATPALEEAPFNRTVVLVLEHGEEGALGLVLNRPSDMELDEPLPRWEPLAAHPPVVFWGGPVDPEAAICLARVRHQIEDRTWKPIVDGLGTLDIERDPDDIGQRVEEMRLFVGYAGWGAGQLEGEIASGAWFVVEARPGDALSTEPDELWRTVLRRQGGRLAVVSAFPADPSLN